MRLTAEQHRQLAKYVLGLFAVQIDYMQGKPAELVTGLLRSLRPIYVRAGDFITREGGVAVEMYFLIAGTASIVKTRGRYLFVVKVLKAGILVDERSCYLIFS
jgi:hypothetical protein